MTWMQGAFLTLSLLYAANGFTSCPFCHSEIIEKQLIFENEHLMVLHDLAPLAKGHMMIIPKRHIAKAHELSKEEWAEFSETLPKIVSIFEKLLGTNQYLLLEKNGPCIGQSVFHAHFHVIAVPTLEDGRKLVASLSKKALLELPNKLSDEQLKHEIETLRSFIN